MLLEYSIDPSKHFKLARLLLRVPQLDSESTTSFAATAFKYLLLVCSSLLWMATVAAIALEPIESLPLLMLRILPQMRVAMVLFKFSVMNRNKVALVRTYRRPLTRVQYPSVLQAEVGLFREEMQKPSKAFAAFVIFTFLHNVPAIIWGVVNHIHKTDDSSQTAKSAIGIWLPFQLMQHEAVRALAHSVTLLTMYGLAFVVFGFSVLFISLASMALKMLSHLNRVLVTLHPGNASEGWSEREVKEVVRYAVQQHQRILAFVGEVNRMFSLILLLDVWTFLFALCSVAYHMAKFPSRHFTLMVALVQNIAVFSVYLGISCRQAGLVTSAAESIGTNCSLATWWETPEIVQDINIMASMAKVKLAFKAGPLYSLNLNTFITVLEIALSYFLFLYQLN